MCSLAPPEVLWQGILASPLSHKTRCRVLPYLMKKDLDVGEVDGDSVVEEPKLGYDAPHSLPFSGVSQEPLLGIEWDPLIRKGSVE